MKFEIGKQYEHDDQFKAAARLHQSHYRAGVLKVGCDGYGNRLAEHDAKALLNYYGGMNVRKELRARYPAYSKSRDADMLRSEHIPFNMFAPLKDDPQLAQRVIESAFGVECRPPFDIRFEHAPKPAANYLGDRTAFDTYIQFNDRNQRTIGLGIEVKFTEQGYKAGKTEGERVKYPGSTYWTVTRKSGMFPDGANAALGADDLRQIWRNHLLGLAMCQRGELSEFVSIVLYPRLNDHLSAAIPKYQQMMKESYRHQVRGCTFERYTDSISGGPDVMAWREYLRARYLVG